MCDKVKIFHIHTHVSTHFFGYYYVPISFISIMSTIRVLMYPGYLIKFPPAISLTWCVPVFWGLMSHTDWIFIYFHTTRVCTIIWIILCWYLRYHQNLLKVVQFHCTSLFLVLFLFLLLPDDCIWVPFRLSCRWWCLWWGVVLPFLFVDYLQWPRPL